MFDSCFLGHIFPFQRWMKRTRQYQLDEVEPDDDVEEEERVANEALGRSPSDGGRDAVALVVKDMAKTFGTFKAVRGLSFTVRQGRDRSALSSRVV